MENFSVLIKPASSACNMNCKYCFYHDEAINRKDYFNGFMTEETLDVLLDRVFEVDAKNYNISFQGGEPTLRGVDFFESLVKKVNKKNINNNKVNYAIQTNGILIDERWCELFSKNNFLVGVSLDGNKEIHDYLRVKSNDGTFNKVLKAIDLFTKYKIDYNVLTVVSKSLAKRYNSVYNFYKKRGFKYLQFIPCLDSIKGDKKEYTLTDEDYGNFLCGLFDLYLEDGKKGEYVSIRLFDNFMAKLQGCRAELCGLDGRCNVNFVIEGDGSVYPCDFYCLDEYLLGNIKENSFKEMFESNVSYNFIKPNFNEECMLCEYYALCGGGCKRERINAKNRFCNAYKKLFEKIKKEFL